MQLHQILLLLLERSRLGGASPALVLSGDVLNSLEQRVPSSVIW